MKNKILVIEDDRAISELLCMNLEAAGYETVAAYDGEEAQRLLLWQEDLLQKGHRLFLAVRKGELRNKAALLFLIFAGGRAPDGAVILHAGSSCPLI